MYDDGQCPLDTHSMCISSRDLLSRRVLLSEVERHTHRIPFVFSLLLLPVTMTTAV